MLCVPAPELDFTQLRTIATNLEALELVFEEIAYQYDRFKTTWFRPTNSGLPPQLEPQNRDWACSGSIKVLTQRERCDRGTGSVTQLDSQNPYAYAYLAFVHLYDWHRQLTPPSRALLPSTPTPPEIQVLKRRGSDAGVVQAWQLSRGGRWGLTKMDKSLH